MKLTFNSDCRVFKKGDVIDLSCLQDVKALPIVGDNGCGKSTIVHALRGKFGKTTSLYASDFAALASHIDVEQSYSNFIFMDAVKDNGSDFMVAFDATHYIESGGFATKNVSHGQGSLFYIARFMEKHKAAIQDGTLIVLDEVDNGLSLANQARYINFVNKLCSLGAHVLVASHNPFFIHQSLIVYDVSQRKMRASSDYITEATGLKIS